MQQPQEEGRPGGRFPRSTIYHAARLYYLENATQAEIARQLGTSRPTVSRLLAEARASGIVHVVVRDPEQDEMDELGEALRAALGLAAAYVVPSTPGVPVGRLLAPAAAAALTGAKLQAGDVLLISSGVTVHGIAQQELIPLPGVLMCPTVGGVEEPEPQYQTNEITRSLALRVHGTPVLLYAPVLPSEALAAVLAADPTMQRITQMWTTAKAALFGIGGAPRGRTSLPSVLGLNPVPLRGAVGDICARPYGPDGQPIDFPGAQRMVAMQLADLGRIPHSIGVGIGEDKVPAMLVATRAGYVNTLVTDSDTARSLIRRNS